MTVPIPPIAVLDLDTPELLTSSMERRSTMGPAEQTFVNEFGPFEGGCRRSFDAGYYAGIVANRAAEARFKLRLRTVTELILEYDGPSDPPSADQMARAGYCLLRAPDAPADTPNALTEAQCFLAELLEEAEELMAFMAGYVDGGVARVAQPEPPPPPSSSSSASYRPPSPAANAKRPRRRTPTRLCCDAGC